MTANASPAVLAPVDVAARWCPDRCPITGRPFFCWIERDDGTDVPTYGGPFDSYTIPTQDENGDFNRERYDHDAGAWVDGCECLGVRLIDDQREDHEWGTVDALAADLAAAREENANMQLAVATITAMHNDERDALRQRAEAAEREALTERALQRAAKELPEGWQLTVEVERGAGWVELRDAAFAEIELANDGDTLAENITAAIDAAIAKETP